MKTSFIISCFVMAVASTPSIVSAQNLLDLEPKTVFTNNKSLDLGPKEIFASKENLDLSAWGDQELHDLKDLSQTKPSIFRQELMLLNFNQMTKFLEIVPKEILKPSMELGGVIGNGGGLVTLPSGSSVPADLYVNFSAFSSSIDLPKYYRPFNFADFPGLKEELSDLIALVNRRASKNFIPTDLDQFTVVETPALLGEIGYPVQPGLPFESVAFTYVTSSFDAKTYELRGGQRVIELKVGAMNKMVNNRDRALLLLHEILHHVDASVYSRFPSRYVLISGLVTHLNAILDARQRQLEGDYRPLSSMEKENNEKLQKIINFYTGDEYRQNYFSVGGGISDSEEFSSTNFLGLGSKIMLLSAYKAKERRNGNNIILESKFKLGDSLNCQGNYFLNVNGEGEKPFEFYCYSRTSKYSNVFVKKPTNPPAVWSIQSRNRKYITDAQISSYKENGYLLVEGELNRLDKVIIEESNNTGMVRVNSSEVINSTLSNATILYLSKINDSKIKSFILIKSKIDKTSLYSTMSYYPLNWDIVEVYQEPKLMENALTLMEIKNSILYLNIDEHYVLDYYNSYRFKNSRQNIYWFEIEKSKYTNTSKIKISGLKLVLNNQARIKFDSDNFFNFNEDDVYEKPNKNIFFATIGNPRNPTVSETVKSSAKTFCDGKSYEERKLLISLNLCVSEN